MSEEEIHQVRQAYQRVRRRPPATDQDVHVRLAVIYYLKDGKIYRGRVPSRQRSSSSNSASTAETPGLYG